MTLEMLQLMQAKTSYNKGSKALLAITLYFSFIYYRYKIRHLTCLPL